ncbi:MAG TPA: ABC transporter ATP-binding protein [Anaerolineales bacterium]|nr:ABC transporter ATP-binding protein [Anaerolineales bacterium]
MTFSRTLTDQILPPLGTVCVEMRGIWKQFPGVIANQNIDLDLRHGEVHSLLGENGAGKSTLMHILSGIYQPDAGHIRLNGEVVQFRSPAQAIASGIGMVHQHFRLVEMLTAAENIHLGWNNTPWRVTAQALARRTQEYCEEFGLHVDPNARIWQLSTGEQQRVEILRVMARGARVLILDEPTSVLTPKEAEELFRVVRGLAASGRSVVLITHKLEEVLAASDCVTVLRNGRVVMHCSTSECDRNSLATWLIGQEFVSRLYREEQAPGKLVLEVRQANVLNDRGLPALKNLNLELHEGEILGIAGVAGNGQSELAEVLSGLRRIENGSIQVDGADLTRSTPVGFVSAGVGHIPEDRLGMGLVPIFSITDNAILRKYKRAPIARGLRIDSRAASNYSQDIVTRSDVKTPSLKTLVRHLSGGNQQRLLAGREMQVASRLLIAVHPTQGLDIGATEEVRRVLMEHRNHGSAVLLISEDLDEILIMSDRIAVMYGGEIAGEFDAAVTDRAEIGLLMGGATLAGDRTAGEEV